MNNGNEEDNQMDKNMKIVVLCGGISTERAISIVSGVGVCGALRQKGHRAILLDVFFGDEYADLMNAFPEEYDLKAAEAYIHSFDGKAASIVQNSNRSFFGANVIKLCKMADIVFLALHGAEGENGKVQAAFDLHGIRYTGTGYVGSALAMDKMLSRIMFRANGIPVAEGITLSKNDYKMYCRDLQDMESSAAANQIVITTLKEQGMELPAVVKVACGGSSVGVYIPETPEAYDKALHDAFEIEEQVIIENYVDGREFSVGVIEGEALPIIEIAPIEGFYDYKNKYTAGAAIETCPADLPGELTRKMKEYAEAAYKTLMLEAYGRIDFMMDSEGGIYALEGNTLPGMTPTSLIPQEAAALGISYPELCEKLIEVSLKKYRDEGI